MFDGLTEALYTWLSILGDFFSDLQLVPLIAFTFVFSALAIFSKVWNKLKTIFR